MAPFARTLDSELAELDSIAGRGSLSAIKGNEINGDGLEESAQASELEVVGREASVTASTAPTKHAAADCIQIGADEAVPSPRHTTAGAASPSREHSCHSDAASIPSARVSRKRRAAELGESACADSDAHRDVRPHALTPKEAAQIRLLASVPVPPRDARGRRQGFRINVSEHIGSLVATELSSLVAHSQIEAQPTSRHADGHAAPAQSVCESGERGDDAPDKRHLVSQPSHDARTESSESASP